MSSSERAIPHLRDVFGISGYTTHYSNYSHQQYHITPPPPPPEQDLKKSSKKKRDNNKTLTSGDVKTLERHLSMKKTIRKKIMRDLQQAFVEDPNEFRTENSTPEQLKAEIRAEAVRFGDKHKRSDNFLDMLRGENYITNNPQRREYDYDAPIAASNNSNSNNSSNEKQSFWKRLTMKTKNKR